MTTEQFLDDVHICLPSDVDDALSWIGGRVCLNTIERLADAVECASEIEKKLINEIVAMCQTFDRVLEYHEH